MMGMTFNGITEAIFLVALALGYIVCYLANREEEKMKIAGYFIGAFIITLSAISIIVNLVFGVMMCGKMKGIVYPHKLMKNRLIQPPLPQPQISPQK